MALENGCKQWECTCLDQQAPVCTDDKQLNTFTDEHGCLCNECVCKPLDEELVCVGFKVVTAIINENNCPVNECRCPECPALQICPLGHIPDDTVESECGCTIRTCIEKCVDNKGCGIELGRHEVVEFEAGWFSTNPVQLKRCGGECISGSVFDELSGVFGKSCNCCSVQEYEDQIIELTNSTSGETKEYTFRQPVLCSCAVTQCGLEDEN